MDKAEYDKVVTDFYSKTFLEIGMKEGLNRAQEGTDQFVTHFINHFNGNMAHGYLSQLHQDNPSLEQKVANYPTHYWKSAQGEDVLREKMLLMSSDYVAPGRGRFLKYGEESENKPLTFLTFIKEVKKTGRDDVIQQSVRELASSIGYFLGVAQDMPYSKDHPEQAEQAKRRIDALQNNIEMIVQKEDSQYSQELRDILVIFQDDLAKTIKKEKEKNQEKQDLVEAARKLAQDVLYAQGDYWQENKKRMKDLEWKKKSIHEANFQDTFFKEVGTLIAYEIANQIKNADLTKVTINHIVTEHLNPRLEIIGNLTTGKDNYKNYPKVVCRLMDTLIDEVKKNNPEVSQGKVKDALGENLFKYNEKIINLEAPEEHTFRSNVLRKEVFDMYDIPSSINFNSSGKKPGVK